MKPLVEEKQVFTSLNSCRPSFQLKTPFAFSINFFQPSVAASSRSAPQEPDDASRSWDSSLSVSPSGFLACLVSFDTSGDAARQKNQLRSHLSAKAADSHLACVRNQMCHDTLLLTQCCVNLGSNSKSWSHSFCQQHQGITDFTHEWNDTFRLIIISSSISLKRNKRV